MTKDLDTTGDCNTDTMHVTIVDEAADTPKVFTVVRRDMLNHECLICDEGTYKLTDFENRVRCDVCTDYAPRWMTKPEMARHTAMEGR